MSRPGSDHTVGESKDLDLKIPDFNATPTPSVSEPVRSKWFMNLINRRNRVGVKPSSSTHSQKDMSFQQLCAELIILQGCALFFKSHHGLMVSEEECDFISPLYYRHRLVKKKFCPQSNLETIVEEEECADEECDQQLPSDKLAEIRSESVKLPKTGPLRRLQNRMSGFWRRLLRRTGRS